MKELKPNVVVLNFGGNDNHSYMTGLPEGVSIGDFAGPSWSTEYRRRLRIVMDTINRAGGDGGLDRAPDREQPDA